MPSKQFWETKIIEKYLPLIVVINDTLEIEYISQADNDFFIHEFKTENSKKLSYYLDTNLYNKILENLDNFNNQKSISDNLSFVWINENTSLVNNYFFYLNLEKIVDNEKKYYSIKFENQQINQSKYYKTIFDKANDGIILFNHVELRIVETNPKAQELFGYTSQEFCNLEVVDLFPKYQENKETTFEKYKKYRKKLDLDKHRRADWIVKTKNKVKLFADITTVRLEVPYADFSLSIVRDISELKKQEQLLVRSKNQLRAVFENTKVGMLVLLRENDKITIRDANVAALNMFGFKTVYNLKESGYQFLRPQLNSAFQVENNSTIFKRVKTILSNGVKEKTFEFCKLKNVNNEPFWANITVFEIESEGNENAIIFEFIEVSTSKIALDEVNSRKNKFEKQYNELRTIIDALPVRFYHKDLNNRVIRLNKTAANKLGGNPEDFENRYVNELYPKRAVEFYEIDKKVIKTKKSIIRLEAQDEDGLWTSTDIVPLKDNKDEVEGLMVFAYNINKIKLAELEMKKMIEELEHKNNELQKYIASNLELENFAYVASHDLKEPVRTIKSFSQLLSRKYGNLLDENGKEYLDFVISAAERMHLLIEDLLTFSRVAHADKAVKREKIETVKVLNSAIYSLSEKIRETKTIISLFNLPDFLFINELKISQVFQNLIANAIKFVEKDKKPIVKIWSEDLGTYYKFYIQDNGIGIDSEFQKNIFVLFKRLHKSKFTGTGLGLSICKKIVELHEGEIGVTSEVGKGSTFYFTIKKLIDFEETLE